MNSLATWVRIGGVLQLGILIASALVPRVLDWRAQLRPLDPLLRQLIWVHGAFVVLAITGFGLLSAVLAGPMTDGSPLARSICGLIAVFWIARLGVQCFVFDARPHLTRPLLAIGYRGLTVAFLYLSVVFSLAALK